MKVTISAVEELCATAADNGINHIVVAPGTYLLESSIRLRSGLTISGWHEPVIKMSKADWKRADRFMRKLWRDLLR